MEENWQAKFPLGIEVLGRNDERIFKHEYIIEQKIDKLANTCQEIAYGLRNKHFLNFEYLGEQLLKRYHSLKTLIIKLKTIYRYRFNYFEEQRQCYYNINPTRSFNLDGLADDIPRRHHQEIEDATKTTLKVIQQLTKITSLHAHSDRKVAMVSECCFILYRISKQAQKRRVTQA